jgi:hypothetical protein
MIIIYNLYAFIKIYSLQKRGKVNQGKIGTTVNATCHVGHTCHRLISPVLDNFSLPHPQNLPQTKPVYTILKSWHYKGT